MEIQIETLILAWNVKVMTFSEKETQANSRLWVGVNQVKSPPYT